MTHKIVIPFTLPGLNQYTSANRTHKKVGAKMKYWAEQDLVTIFKSTLRWATIKTPVIMHCIWVEKDFRRDGDNISFAKKFLLDALVKAEVLRDDSRKFVVGFVDDFAVNKFNPRIEIMLIEV